MKAMPYIFAALTAPMLASCGTRAESADCPRHRLAVLDPGHFHAALVQKSPLANVCDSVTVFAPQGEGLDQYLAYVDSYNSRDDNPTSWVVDTVTSPDYLARLAADKSSDIVVLAGDNSNKTRYIATAVHAGKNVLADKPMAIDGAGFEMLRDAYAEAEKSGVLIYELMTERYDTLNIVTRQILADTATFGSLVDVSMTSTHHFYKEVSGKPLTRPAWYYDVNRQGEGIADVTTHLIDLVMWQCFPDQSIEISDTEVVDAKHWPTTITPEQFRQSTGAVIDAPIDVMCNGYIDARVKGVPMRFEVQWNFVAPQGSGDTFTATYRGTKGTVRVVQDASTGFVKELYIDDNHGNTQHIEIPVAERLGHEDHFNRVTSAFLAYLDGKSVPAWERANTIAKYHITTSAVEKSRLKE